MANWRQALTHTANDIEVQFDRLKYRLRERLGGRNPIIILPYRGFGTPERLYLKGRVLEDKGIRSAQENDSLWDNLVNMYKRFESDEIPYAQVRVKYAGTERSVTADEEGFFDAWIEPEQPVESEHVWQQIGLELIKPIRENTQPAVATGDVFIPPATARFGVISDIDDTVVQTDAGHLLHMARTVFLGNARTRLPFKGVAAFYRALYHGLSGDERNPLFYVSSSPWNLYDLLSDFFELQKIPGGPILFLRDWGLTEEEFLPTDHRNHKMQVCKRVLDTYVNLPFILVGDSGQQDPEIYNEIVQEYPNRILAVYIRNVSKKPERVEAIRRLAEKLVNVGSTLILADDTLPLAEHAIQQGWIAPSAFPEIQVEKQADEAPPTPLEQLLGEAEKPQAPTVVIDSENPKETERNIQGGAIESTLEKDSKKPTPVSKEKPPNVVVKGKKKDKKD